MHFYKFELSAKAEEGFLPPNQMSKFFIDTKQSTSTNNNQCVAILYFSLPYLQHAPASLGYLL